VCVAKVTVIMRTDSRLQMSQKKVRAANMNPHDNKSCANSHSNCCIFKSTTKTVDREMRQNDLATIAQKTVCALCDRLSIINVKEADTLKQVCYYSAVFTV
jgi:hypothetical protein